MKSSPFQWLISNDTYVSFIIKVNLYFQEIRKDFTSLVQEVEQLKMEQQTAMTNILQEMRMVMDTADKLQGNLNLKEDEQPEL